MMGSELEPFGAAGVPSAAVAATADSWVSVTGSLVASAFSFSSSDIGMFDFGLPCAGSELFLYLHVIIPQS